MAQRQTVKIALRAPVAKPYTKDGEEKTLWNIVSSDSKQKFVAFDEKLIQAFEQAKLEGQEHEYVIVPTSEPGRDPMVVGIPGVFEAKKRGGGGGSRPLLTDKQAALLAASFRGGPIEELLKQADRFAAWLAGESPAPLAAQNASQAQRSNGEAEKARLQRPAKFKHLRALVDETRADPSKILTHYGYEPDAGLESLTDEQLLEAIARLETRLQQQKEPA